MRKALVEVDTDLISEANLIANVLNEQEPTKTVG